MRRIASILIILLLLGTTVQAMTLDRTCEFMLDGDIKFVSIAGSQAGEVVLDIRGSGVVEGVVQTTTRADYLQNNTNIDMIAEHNLSAIVGVRIADNDSQVYVSKVSPSYGETANIGQDIEVDIQDFRAFDIETDIGTSFGGIQRRINFENEGLTLWEYLDFTGHGWMLDNISFSVGDTEQESTTTAAATTRLWQSQY